MPDLRDPYAALRFRDFRLYNMGWIIAVIGEQILEVAVGWDLYQRTHNALTLGWVGLVSAIPVIALALPAGHLADRSSGTVDHLAYLSTQGRRQCSHS